MSDTTPTAKPISLEALLSANKEQFDKLFSRQTGENGLIAVSRRPATRQDLASASIDAADKATASELDTFLAGRSSSSEIIEHKVERGRVTVLCKLTVDGVSKMQFGSAQLNGDEGKALQRATDDALNLCARQFIAEEGNLVEVDAAEAPVAETEAPVEVSQPVHAPEPAVAIARPAASARLNVITLDLIENALRNARHEMDAVLFRSAMSPVIREQHDEFPMITDAKGRMIVGQFGSYITEMLKERDFQLAPGDVILQSDPFLCGGAISHINDWMVLVPVFLEDELVGFTSMFGHMLDVGGPVPGSMPTAATSSFGEGMRIPPIKIYEGGVLNQGALDLIMNNTRTPEMNYSDLMAIIAGCRAGEKRVIEICQRFGKDIYRQAC